MATSLSRLYASAGGLGRGGASGGRRLGREADARVVELLQVLGEGHEADVRAVAPELALGVQADANAGEGGVHRRVLDHVRLVRDGRARPRLEGEVRAIREVVGAAGQAER